MLHTFSSNSNADGWAPVGGLSLTASGTLFGTTKLGGTNYLGTVFEVTPGKSGAPAQYQIIHSFSGPDGGYPVSRPVIGPNGHLYGTAAGAGVSSPHGFGTVYDLAPPTGNGDAWIERTLFTFPSGPQGGHPEPQLAISPKGVLFGETITGGANGYGTVFLLVP